MSKTVKEMLRDISVSNCCGASLMPEEDRCAKCGEPCEPELIEDDAQAEAINSGGTNKFYKFPEYVNDVDSLARHWKLSFSEGNILKTLTAKTGTRHSGTDMKREYKKCLHYAIERLLAHGISPQEIEDQIMTQLEDK